MFMIAGPNGAGKSTLYETRIQPRIDANIPFINADNIQRDELKDPSMVASYKAAEIAENRRQEHLTAGKSFVAESTFSHPSKLALIGDAKAAGFRVVMYHVSLRNANLSVARVKERVRSGGHGVPENKIRERYLRNQPIIRDAVLLSDRAYIYDNSVLGKAPSLSIKFNASKVVGVESPVPAWARDLYAKELEPFSLSKLNPSAASFADAKSIVHTLSGSKGQLRIPDAGSEHIGVVVGETAKHIIQQTKQAEYIAHFKAALSTSVEQQAICKISYSAIGRGSVERATIEEQISVGLRIKGWPDQKADKIIDQMKLKAAQPSVAKAAPEPAQAKNKAPER
jgi:predicted ABC-type ATPase